MLKNLISIGNKHTIYTLTKLTKQKIEGQIYVPVEFPIKMKNGSSFSFK